MHRKTYIDLCPGNHVEKQLVKQTSSMIISAFFKNDIQGKKHSKMLDLEHENKLTHKFMSILYLVFSGFFR